MNISYNDIIGYVAAVITNISMYPQAYDVYVIMSTRNYEKLSSLSLGTFSITGFGCCLWIIYGINLSIYPIIFGCIMTIIPSFYISCTLLYARKILLYNNISQNDSTNPSIDNL